MKWNDEWTIHSHFWYIFFFLLFNRMLIYADSLFAFRSHSTLIVWDFVFFLSFKIQEQKPQVNSAPNRYTYYIYDVFSEFHFHIPFPHSVFTVFSTKLKIKCFKLPHIFLRKVGEKFDVEKLITCYYNQLYSTW